MTNLELMNAILALTEDEAVKLINIVLEDKTISLSPEQIKILVHRDD